MLTIDLNDVGGFGQSVVVHDNDVYIIGGANGYPPTRRNIVYRSSDLMQWDRWGVNAWAPRNMVSATVLTSGQLLMVGGVDQPPSAGTETNANLRNDVWRFDIDTREWELMNGHAPWLPRSSSALTVSQDRVCVLSGNISSVFDYTVEGAILQQKEVCAEKGPQPPTRMSFHYTPPTEVEARFEDPVVRRGTVSCPLLGESDGQLEVASAFTSTITLDPLVPSFNVQLASSECVGPWGNERPNTTFHVLSLNVANQMLGDSSFVVSLQRVASVAGDYNVTAIGADVFVSQTADQITVTPYSLHPVTIIADITLAQPLGRRIVTTTGQLISTTGQPATLSANGGTMEEAGIVPVTLSFNQNVAGLSLDNITVVEGTATKLTRGQGPDQYVVHVSPSGPEFWVYLPANVVFPFGNVAFEKQISVLPCTPLNRPRPTRSCSITSIQ
jgi:hypothetical protein